MQEVFKPEPSQHASPGMQADIDVTVKGARPQPKIYTDFHGTVEGVSGCYGPGLEPSIWQVCAFSLWRLPLLA